MPPATPEHPSNPRVADVPTAGEQPPLLEANDVLLGYVRLLEQYRFRVAQFEDERIYMRAKTDQLERDKADLQEELARHQARVGAKSN